MHCHNKLRNVFTVPAILAHRSVKFELRNNLTPNHNHSRFSCHNWTRGLAAAFVTSLINTFSAAGVSPYSADQAI